MQQIYILDYSFLFSDNSPFSNVFEFERLLGQFLDSRGMEAIMVKAVEGSPAKRIMVIRKKEVVAGMPTKNPVGRPQTLKSKIQELSDRKLRKPAIQFMKGKK